MTFAWRFPGRGIKRAQPDRLRPFYVICARAILRQVRILTKNYADMKKQQSDKLNAVKDGRGDRIRSTHLWCGFGSRRDCKAGSNPDGKMMQI